MRLTLQDLDAVLVAHERITNEQWLASLSERKRKEIEFHDRDRDRTQMPSPGSDTYERFYGNKKYYAATERSKSYVEQWLATNVRGKVFLDYACGNGKQAIAAARSGASLSIGIDISAVSVQNARADAAAAGVSGNSRFVQGDAENTRLPDGSIDVILCSGMLHHLDLSYAFPELRRILAPGGKILCVEALDYNPAIKFYRWRTPEMRTEWEAAHILQSQGRALRAPFLRRQGHALLACHEHPGPASFVPAGIAFRHRRPHVRSHPGHQADGVDVHVRAAQESLGLNFRRVRMQKSLKIWLVTVGEPLPREGNSARLWRTGILARTLVDRGHDVTWWTSSVDHFTKTQVVQDSRFERVEPRLALQFLHGRLYTRNISLARFLNHRDIAAEFTRLAARAPRPDIILCSYPTIELSDAAVSFGSRHDVPVLLDVRDLWPDEITARLPALLRPAAPLLLYPLYRAARRSLGHATGIVAISRTYQQWARKMGGRAPDESDLFVPMGYEPMSQVAPAAAAEARLRGLGVAPARKIVWFCGTFVGSIDLATPIETARALAADPSLQFVFTGAGERDSEWRAAARGLDNVIFTGWADRDEIGYLARLAWVGLAAYKRGAMMSLPNKLFEYMAAGLPVVSSLAGEAAELLVGNDAGVAYSAGDAGDLGEKLVALAGDPDRRDRMARNGHSLFERSFVAHKVYTAFAEHLERCAARGRAATSDAASAGPALKAESHVH